MNRKRHLGRIEKQILTELTLGDLLYGFLLSARSTGRMNRLARERANERYRRKLAIERLKELRYIELRGAHLSITDDGRNSIGHTVHEIRNLLKTKTWDNKWRIVAFDIPEKYATLRDKVRRILKEAGFLKFQNSIWVFPHECEELVRLIQEESRLSKYVLYGVLERIGDEKRLKMHFRL